ncbi:MAG: hypothetical protein AAF705_16285, partial [Bacteroidota bacterium]
MKTKKLSFKTLTAVRALSLMLLSTLLFTSCDNTEEKEISLITEEDAVEVLESALMDGSEGISNEAQDAALVAKNYSGENANISSCGESFDSTVMKVVNQTAIQASYSTSWTWTITCNDFSIPQTLTFGRTASGNYETNRFTGESQSSSDWLLDNLILGGSWNLDGTCSRNGTHQSKVRNQNAFSFDLNMVIAGLEVDKDEPEILAGEGTFTLL